MSVRLGDGMYVVVGGRGVMWSVGVWMSGDVVDDDVGCVGVLNYCWC